MSPSFLPQRGLLLALCPLYLLHLLLHPRHPLPPFPLQSLFTHPPITRLPIQRGILLRTRRRSQRRNGFLGGSTPPSLLRDSRSYHRRHILESLDVPTVLSKRRYMTEMLSSTSLLCHRYRCLQMSPPLTRRQSSMTAGSVPCIRSWTLSSGTKPGRWYPGRNPGRLSLRSGSSRRSTKPTDLSTNTRRGL